MNFRKNILFRYYPRETKFCLAAMDFSDRKCVNRYKSKLHFNASTYNSDKRDDRLMQKAVESEFDIRDNGESKSIKGVTERKWQTTTTKNEDRTFHTKFFALKGSKAKKVSYPKL